MIVEAHRDRLGYGHAHADLEPIDDVEIAGITEPTLATLIEFGRVVVPDRGRPAQHRCSVGLLHTDAGQFG